MAQMEQKFVPYRFKIYDRFTIKTIFMNYAEEYFRFVSQHIYNWFSCLNFQIILQ